MHIHRPIIKYYNQESTLQKIFINCFIEMGKKSKMVNEDPILKKNFRLEKRKKQREEEKQKMRQEKQQQEKRLQQFRLIEKQVQSDLDKHLQQQKQLLLTHSSKTKLINKNHSFINAFKNKDTLKNSPKQSTKTIQLQFIKHLPAFSIKSQSSPYAHHFQQKLPKEVNELLSKEKKMTQVMKMEQEIKQQIKSMFSVQKVGDEIYPVRHSEKMSNRSDDPKLNELEKALEDQEKEEEPYIIDRKGKVESEGLIKGKIYTFSKLALAKVSESQCFNKDVIQDENHTANEVQTEYETASQVINNYMDYIHVQNNEQQTIEEFRTIVVRHMYHHQLQCLKALKSNDKSKGFTNSKFLILAPYVGDAKAIFDLIEAQFVLMSDEEGIFDTQTQQVPKKKKKQLEWVVENKEKIEENEDDEDDFFRVGIKILPKKKKIVYFSNFDSSDIIVASPIGLKSIINGEAGKKQISFLSSVQVLYVDRASVIMMQNWDHLLDVLNNINYMPKYQSLKNSINDIRQSHLELKGRLFRQNIVFTEFGFPQLNSLKLNHFQNWQGTVSLKPIFVPTCLEKNEKIERNFYKIELKQAKDDLETRFEYFKRKFWDKIHNNDQMKKVVLFVNSYFEFVKLKGFLQKVNASFEAISEHTKRQKIQSRVSLFNNNSYRILLITERAYYFGVCQIKKQRHVFYYSLPRNGFIYKEMIENMQEDREEESKIVCLYSKYDKFIVERLVGSAKAVEMVREYCSNVSFIV